MFSALARLSFLGAPFKRRSCATLTIICVSLASVVGPVGSAQAAQGPAGVTSPSWLLLDGNSGQVLAEHNANDRRSIASLTKLMTTLVIYRAIEAGRLHWDQQITIPQQVMQLGSDTSRMFVRPNTQVSVDTLMHGLIIVSANDAAISLAIAEAGNLDNFVQQMNDTAQSLGMHDTHFENVDGLTQQGHYSTAHDLSILAQTVAEEFPDYMKISSLPDFRFGPFHGYATNALVRSNPAIDGMKTGYTAAAGNCVIATEHRPDGSGNQRRLYAVVLGDKTHSQRFKDANTLLDYGYNNFYNVHIGSAGVPLGEFPLWKGEQSTVGVTANKDLVLSMPNDIPANQLKGELVADKSPLLAPVHAGDKIGAYNISLGGHRITSGPLYASEPVEQEGILARAIDTLKLDFGGAGDKAQLPLKIHGPAL